MEIQPLTAQINVVIDKQTLINKINQLQQTIKTLTQEKAQLEQDLASANAQIESLNTQIQSLTAQISDLQNQVNNLQSNLDLINGEIVENKTEYLLETKNQIKNAIVNKSVSVETSDTFRSYATKINQIPQSRTITDKNTLLLCPFDESPTKDIGPFEYVLQTVGNPVISSNQMLFNKPTLYLDGSSALILNDSNFQIFMGNFTLEFWWFPTDYSRTQTYSFLGQDAKSQYSSASNYREYWQHYCIRSNRAEVSFCDNNNGITGNTLALNPEGGIDKLKLNQWNHLAFVKNAESGLKWDIFRVYLNGININWNSLPYISDYYHQLINPQTVLAPLTIFFFRWVNGNQGQYIKGYVSNLRLSNCARYTTDSFTPPTQPFSI